MALFGGSGEEVRIRVEADVGDAAQNIGRLTQQLSALDREAQKYATQGGILVPRTLQETSRQLDAGARAAQEYGQKTGQAFTSVDEVTKRLGDSVKTVVMGYIGVQGVQALIQFTTRVYGLRDAAEDAATMLSNKFAGGARDAALAVQRLAAETHGLVSNLTLMRTASAGIEYFQRFGMDQQQALAATRSIAEYAALRSDAMGMDASAAIAGLMGAMRSGRDVALAAYGINIPNLPAGLTQDEREEYIRREGLAQIRDWLAVNRESMVGNIGLWDRVGPAVENFLVGNTLLPVSDVPASYPAASLAARVRAAGMSGAYDPTRFTAMAQERQAGGIAARAQEVSQAAAARQQADMAELNRLIHGRKAAADAIEAANAAQRALEERRKRVDEELVRQKQEELALDTRMAREKAIELQKQYQKVNLDAGDKPNAGRLGPAASRAEFIRQFGMDAFYDQFPQYAPNYRTGWGRFFGSWGDESRIAGVDKGTGEIQYSRYQGFQSSFMDQFYPVKGGLAQYAGGMLGGMAFGAVTGVLMGGLQSAVSSLGESIGLWGSAAEAQLEAAQALREAARAQNANNYAILQAQYLGGSPEQIAGNMLTAGLYPLISLSGRGSTRYDLSGITSLISAGNPAGALAMIREQIAAGSFFGQDEINSGLAEDVLRAIMAAEDALGQNTEALRALQKSLEDDLFVASIRSAASAEYLGARSEEARRLVLSGAMGDVEDYLAAAGSTVYSPGVSGGRTHPTFEWPEAAEWLESHGMLGVKISVESGGVASAVAEASFGGEIEVVVNPVTGKGRIVSNV